MEKLEKDLKDVKNEAEKKLEEVREEISRKIKEFNEMSQEDKKEKIKNTASETVDKTKNAILGEDGKFDSSDLKRIANGGLEIAAGIAGGIEHGFGWLRNQIEKVKID